MASASGVGEFRKQLWRIGKPLMLTTSVRRLEIFSINPWALEAAESIRHGRELSGKRPRLRCFVGLLCSQNRCKPIHLKQNHLQHRVGGVVFDAGFKGWGIKMVASAVWVGVARRWMLESRWQKRTNDAEFNSAWQTIVESRCSLSTLDEESVRWRRFSARWWVLPAGVDSAGFSDITVNQINQNSSRWLWRTTSRRSAAVVTAPTRMEAKVAAIMATTRGTAATTTNMATSIIPATTKSYSETADSSNMALVKNPVDTTLAMISFSRFVTKIDEFIFGDGTNVGLVLDDGKERR